MSDIFKMITDIAQYPTWFKVIVAVCIQLVAVISICLLFFYKPPSKDNPLAEKKSASVSEKKQDFVPLVDIEFLTTMRDEHNFVYEIIVHNKSNVPISNIMVLRRILAERTPKMAFHPAKTKLKSHRWTINALKAGESKKIHTERSESYEQATFDVVYLDEYRNRYIAGFVGDRDGVILKKNYKHEKEKKKKIKVHSP